MHAFRRIPCTAVLLGGTILAGHAPALADAHGEKPETLKIGITAFLSGPASVFGVPAREAAEMIAERINAEGGIDGVQIELSFIDEGAGAETLTNEYRRLVQDEDVGVMFASISSGNCLNIAPLAEDLGVVNLMWDCGTQRIFEEAEYTTVFRTQANATPEMMATVLYLLQNNPDFETVAVVNQDYSWGRDSWELFQTALTALKPDARVVAELFPKLGAPDFSAEITRLQALRPDVILSTAWGGDLDTFVRQASQRGLTETSQLVLPLAESSIQRLAGALPDGAIVGARGDHYFLHPEFKDEADFQTFVGDFRERTGDYPIYSVFHMAQAFAALEGAYAAAMEANGGMWPTTEQLAAALRGLEFQGYGRPVTIREDGQGVEAQLIGVARTVEGYAFPIIDQMQIYAGEALMPPVGTESISWIEGLDAAFLETPSESYAHEE